MDREALQLSLCCYPSGLLEPAGDDPDGFSLTGPQLLCQGARELVGVVVYDEGYGGERLVAHHGNAPREALGTRDTAWLEEQSSQKDPTDGFYKQAGSVHNLLQAKICFDNFPRQGRHRPK